MGYKVHLTECFEVEIDLRSRLKLFQHLKPHAMMQDPGRIAAVTDLAIMLALLNEATTDTLHHRNRT